MITDTKGPKPPNRIETHHAFSTPAAAWEFMRACHANGLMAGYPGLEASNIVRVLRAASRGHLALLDHGTQEAFEECGEVFLAPTDRPLDIQGRRQGARWVCSRSHWDRHFDTLFAARIVSNAPPHVASNAPPAGDANVTCDAPPVPLTARQVASKT